MASPARPSLRWEQQRAADIIQLLSLYRPLLDSYIIDFFTEGLWAQLPPAWQRALGTATPQQLAKLLGCQGGPGEGGAWPLSLLAFVAATRALSCPRGGQLGPGAGGVGGSAPPCQSPLLHPLLRRHLKPKKQHEVQRLGKLLQLLSQATGCEQVVDVGAGQGHLSRFLAFGLGLSVTAVEGDQSLAAAAQRLDRELLRELGKRGAVPGGRAQQGPQSQPRRNQAPSQCPQSHQPPSQCPQPPSQSHPHHPQCPQPPSQCHPDQPQCHQTPSQCHQSHQTPSQCHPDQPQCPQPPSQCHQNPSKHHQDPSHAPQLPSPPPPRRRRRPQSPLTPRPPLHVAGRLDPAAPGGEFLLPAEPCPAARRPAAGPRNPLWGWQRQLLAGLHCCGDLGPALLRHFARSPWVPALVSVGCCYMKLSTGPCQPSAGHPPPGYPLSASVAALPGHQLSYRAREGACHALEEYQERLAQGSCRLRAHCYRAALERLIREALPGCRRQAVPTARGAHERPFPEYASRSLARLGLAAGSAALAAEQVQAMLGQHHRVVAFFSLGLLLAPLVESLILLDRLLYLREQGLQCALVPLFEPRFSPRNLVLVAARTGLGTVLAELAQGTEEELGRAEPAEGGQRPPGAGQQPQ